MPTDKPLAERYADAILLVREVLAEVKDEHDADSETGEPCGCSLCERIDAALAALGGGNG